MNTADHNLIYVYNYRIKMKISSLLIILSILILSNIKAIEQLKSTVTIGLHQAKSAFENAQNVQIQHAQSVILAFVHTFCSIQ